jgi:2-dehydro-3-deoxyphosphogluconate aldolase / (4S)-4-hydroxy-2-oxoglutarate aldolase
MGAIERISAERVVAVVRRTPEPDLLVAALRAGGIRIVEITLDSEGALDTIERLRRDDELTVLAGTVRTAGEAEAAAQAGAAACVSPAVVPAVIERCAALGLPSIPGALTPTEIEAAWELGAAMVKLFPASLGGPAYVRDVLAPLGEVPLLVTGGVDTTNAAAYLRAGAAAVGVGSALLGAPDVTAAARDLVGSARDA